MNTENHTGEKILTKVAAATPLYIRMHENDNVAIVVNDGGLPAGTVFPGEFTLIERIPQGHKIALRNIAEGEPVLRYDVVIGYAVQAIMQGSWVEESLVRMPEARDLVDLPIATRTPEAVEALEGYTFEGFRNADGSVGTRNILAITTTVQWWTTPSNASRQNCWAIIPTWTM